jgi:hypothetical protein
MRDAKVRHVFRPQWLEVIRETYLAAPVEGDGLRV